MSEAGAPGPGVVLGGRYRLDSLIGAGGMATVWHAGDRRLDRAVAVKVLSDTLAHDPDYLARFAREARMAAGLSHPNVVKVLDYSARPEERPFLVLELLEHGTLAERLDGGRPPDAERLAAELLGALEHIHRHGIVHRDVKPANVLFDGDGNAKLTDFGIAQPDDATRLTGTGLLIGTLRYMAPELTAGQPADAQSDLYALGVVLSECDPPAEMMPLVDRLTAAERDQRPASASAALAMLPTAGHGEGLSPIPREIEVPLRPRLLLVPLALAALVAAAVLALGGNEDGSEPQSDRDRPRQERADGGAGGDRQANAADDPSPAPVPPPEEDPQPTAALPAGCDRLGLREEVLKERGKEAGDAAGSKEEQERVKESFKERAERAKERRKACEESEKRDEDAEEDDEGDGDD